MVFGIFTTLHIVFLCLFLFFNMLLRGASKKQFLSCSAALNYSDQHVFVRFNPERKSHGHSKMGRGKGGE